MNNKSNCPNCDRKQFIKDIEYEGDQNYHCKHCKKDLRSITIPITNEEIQELMTAEDEDVVFIWVIGGVTVHIKKLIQ